MSGVEIFLSVAGAVGLAQVVKVIVERLFSKKADSIANRKDEFAILKERLEFADKEIKRLNAQQINNSAQQIKNSMMISRLYKFMADLVKQTCSKPNCNMRDLIYIDFDSIENDEYDKDHTEENVTETVDEGQ